LEIGSNSHYGLHLAGVWGLFLKDARQILPQLGRIYALLRQAQIIILKILNVWMPVPLYLSGVVIIFAFLDLGKNT
jgi:hypothetical protein